MFALGACGDDASGDAARDGGASAADAAAHVETSCEMSVEVDVVFYQNTCYSARVECDDKEVTPIAMRQASFCDLMEITCTEPDRSTHTVLSWHRIPGGCRFCSDADGLVRCHPLEDTCDPQRFEHIASGSPETGTVPQGNYCDAGVDDDAGR